MFSVLYSLFIVKGVFISILFSGDFHANEDHELSYITKKSLLKNYPQEKYDSIKYHIILGDGAFLWPGNHEVDIYNYKALAGRPFPVLCVVGNHDPVLGMKGLPEVDFGIGEAVYQIQAEPFVAYLKRGKVYTIDGFKILALGGALSIDKKWRRPGISWWKEEYWSEEEKQDLFKHLELENNFDLVISHTGPQHINDLLFQPQMYSAKKFYDEVAFLNDEVHKRIEFHEWLCGHWHRHQYHYNEKTKRGYQYLYRRTKILDRVDGRIVEYNEQGTEHHDLRPE